MDKHLEPTKSITEPEFDSLFDLDDAIDDLMYTAEHAERNIQRFALCVDATSSMYQVWDRAKTALKTAVDHIQKHATCPISIRIVAYRDHIDDDPESVLELSEWSNDTDYLKEFITHMHCHGGGDYPESIGHGLGVLQKDQIWPNQVILIGDAPGKEGSYGYAEAQIFGNKGCPIYALYTDTDRRLVMAFERIAKLSGGKAFLLSPTADLDDIFKVLLAHNKALQITYQATSIEGRRLEDTIK